MTDIKTAEDVLRRHASELRQHGLRKFDVRQLTEALQDPNPSRREAARRRLQMLGYDA